VNDVRTEVEMIRQGNEIRTSPFTVWIVTAVILVVISFMLARIAAIGTVCVPAINILMWVLGVVVVVAVL
jgi:hypothetical protein